MVASRDGSQSARSRIPSMQLARLNGGAGTEGQQGAGEFSWAVAIAEPMPPLHGFCLAVVGLETGMVGAAATLVKRSMETKEEEAAVGFLGFEKVKQSVVFVAPFDTRERRAVMSHPRSDRRRFSLTTSHTATARMHAHPVLPCARSTLSRACENRLFIPSLALTPREWRIPSSFSASCL